MHSDLAGRLALVIGGTGDIGRAAAAQLAQRGARVVLTYANDEVAAKEAVAELAPHGQADLIRSDATDPAAVARLFEDVVTRHGRPSIVVHTPGQVRKKWLTRIDDADFDWLVAVNLRSVFLTLRAAAEHVLDGGRIIVVSTTLAAKMPGPFAVYAATKAAGDVLVKSLSQELGPRRITVNSVAPGPVDNDFFRGEETPESIVEAAGFSPQGRLGTAVDVAAVIGFLAGDTAQWVSGQIIRANGGMY
ncbi:SDR family oxidoreductase [Hamadaea tsunoensis]|uniref:SDR family oxidoreductase n=1 Tax=Hamadaea tsunoensis TaxID=53368 RepID=UPI0004849F0A|nr:SDR family oxidoreductase [Hamadaea tsunoensis]